MNTRFSFFHAPGGRRLCTPLALCLSVLFLSPAVQTQDALYENNGKLQDELRYIREEIRRLQAATEESQKLVEQLRQQQLDQYLELERRLLQLGARLEGLEAPAAEAPPDAAGSAQMDAYRQYQEARGMLNQGRHTEALDAFRGFLSRWPQGEYTAEAWFWTGELYLQSTPPALEEARRAFGAILAHFPGHGKEPDAMFKLGKIYHLQGKPEQAEQTLRQLVEAYGDSAHSAARLAEGYLQQYF